nr:fimbrillin family protein [Prevotella sp.]
MKVYINRYLMMAISSVMMLSSCSSNNDLDGEQTGTVPLQLSLLNDSTRSVITSTILPDSSNYGIFVVDSSSLSPLSNGNNVSVIYASGKSKISSNIFLSSTRDYVYAYYPYSSSLSLTSFNIETASQTDYLYGTSVDSNGSIVSINAKISEAKIKFNHAMARVTFNITQDASDTNSNVITQVKIGTVPTAYTCNLITKSMTLKSSGEVSATCKIAPSASVQSVDMLVLPVSNYSITVSFYINNKWMTTSMTGINWMMGHQYIYPITIIQTSSAKAFGNKQPDNDLQINMGEVKTTKF